MPNNIDKHLEEVLGLSPLAIGSSEGDIYNFKPNDIFNILDINSNFVKVYKKFYDKSNEMDKKYLDIVDNLINFTNSLTDVSESYTFIRRIKEALDLLRNVDPYLNYKFVKVVSMSTNIDSDYMPVQRTTIVDSVSSVIEYLDISSSFGYDLLLQSIYEINPANKDEFGNVIVTIKIDLHPNSKINTVISNLYCNKYEVIDVNFYDNFKLVADKSNISIEKYKDYIQIVSDDSYIVDYMTITINMLQSSSDSEDKYLIGIGSTKVGDIDEWTINNTSTINVGLKSSVILANYLYENFNSSSIGNSNIFIPNIDSTGTIRVHGKISIYSYGDNAFNIHPIPIQEVDGDDKFLIFINGEYIDVNSSSNPGFILLGDMLLIKKDMISKYNMSISQELRIIYIPTNNNISNWYPREYITNNITYQHKNDYITCKSLNGDYWSGDVTLYSKSRYIDVDETGNELVEHIVVPDGEKFEVDVSEYSKPKLFIREYLKKDGTPMDFNYFFGNGGYQYIYGSWSINGSVSVIVDLCGKQFTIPVSEYFNPSTGKVGGYFDSNEHDGTPIRLDLNSKALEVFSSPEYSSTTFRIYYQPFNIEEVKSNISLSKNSNIKKVAISGSFQFPLTELIPESEIAKWTISKNSFINPTYSNVRYSPVSVSNQTVSSIVIDGDIATITLENTSLNEEVDVTIYRLNVDITSDLNFNKITYNTTPIVYLGT